MSRLYGTVELKTNKQCITLEAFSTQPEIMQHIHTLIVRPNNMERTPTGDFLDETVVSTAIIRMSSRLPALKSFTWDGGEMPGDGLWHSLRKLFVEISFCMSALNRVLDSCPLLKSISTSVGLEPLRNDSHVCNSRFCFSLSDRDNPSVV